MELMYFPQIIFMARFYAALMRTQKLNQSIFRMKFEELFFLQLSILNNMSKNKEIKSGKHKKERFSDQIKTKLRDLKPLQ